MSISAADWKMWALGVFLVIVSGTASIAYGQASARMDRIGVVVKADHDVMLTTTAALEPQVREIREKVTDLKHQQEKLQDNQNELIRKVDILLIGVSKDSKRWNKEMDKLK